MIARISRTPNWKSIMGNWVTRRKLLAPELQRSHNRDELNTNRIIVIIGIFFSAKWTQSYYYQFGSSIDFSSFPVFFYDSICCFHCSTDRRITEERLALASSAKWIAPLWPEPMPSSPRREANISRIIASRSPTSCASSSDCLDAFSRQSTRSIRK